MTFLVLVLFTELHVKQCLVVLSLEIRVPYGLGPPGDWTAFSLGGIY